MAEQNGSTMREYFDSLGDCGHRIGSLIFKPTGLRCPTCQHEYPWATPLTEVA
jgi:hypothetical protein